MQGVRFTIGDLAAGFAEARGLLSIAGGELRLQWAVHDAVFGVLKGGCNEARVPLAELSEVRFHPGWWHGRLVLRATDLQTLAGVPGADRDELVLRVERKDRAAAAEVAAEANLLAAEARLSALAEAGSPG